ncbi:hypothetical protein [Deinococcus aquaticus]|uniref:hypothetical protein n=1 Tax=Deinococcus aquaticus TaxID=328692 RepID=UPI003F4550EA
MIKAGKPVSFAGIIKSLAAIFLFSVISLPTGIILGVNFKIILSIIMLAAILIYLISIRKIEIGLVVFSVFSIAFICFLILMTLNGTIFNGNNFAFRELSDFISAFYVIFILFVVYKLNLLKMNELIRISIVAAVAYSTVKVLVFFAIFFGYIDYRAVISIMENSLGLIPIIDNYGNGIIRIQIANDSILPYILFFYLIGHEKLKSINVITVILLVGFAITVSFARYYWFAGLFCAITPLLFTAITERRGAKNTISSLIAAVVFLGLVGYISEDKIVKNVLSERISGNGTVVSDRIRVEQIYYLQKEFDKKPLFGNGMGGNIKTYRRSEYIPYAYEVQWLGYLMKFGIIGTFALIIFVLSVISIDFRKLISVFIASAYIVWLMSGMFNPNLVSSAGGAIFGMFLVAFESIKNRHRIGGAS